MNKTAKPCRKRRCFLFIRKYTEMYQKLQDKQNKMKIIYLESFVRAPNIDTFLKTVDFLNFQDSAIIAISVSSITH